ncbi:o-succinylbenzoate--CoA ligase [Peribacillus kribbensis]|uniref:o-succinylbenzoate--CoA ligase n=1 Tax=Peribacillus kribbensis TaxID=356658 RepID=UPI0004797BFB|nr:o-succinylbenzoate--CoA ligase [Peribacillus kribbensis]
MHQSEMPNWLVKRADLSPDRVGLAYKGETFTFAEIKEEAEKWAGSFYQSGIRRGDTVGLLVGNHPNSVFMIHSLFFLGVKVLMLNRRLTGREMEFQLTDSDASFLILEEAFQGKLSQMEHPSSLKVLIADRMNPEKSKDAPLLEEFIENDIATIMYTSGTTGNPKGVLQTFSNHWWSAIGSVLNLGLGEQDSWLCSVPIFHISGLSILMKSVIYGITVVLHESFDEEEINRAILEEGVTTISVVTSMLNRLIKQLGDRRYPESFRCMLLGGGPAPLPLLESCRERNIPVYQTYGMTETSSQIVTLAPEYSIQKLGSAGKPLFPARLFIEKDGKEARANEAGEIVVKGPNVVSGYYNRPRQSAEAFRDGWFYTGDIGMLDEEGFLYVLDRRSDLIISGGENIYPAEIESVLSSHPLIFEAGAAPHLHERWGQVPYAYVVPAEGASLTEKEILEFCGENLASYKIPKKIYFVDELPRNSSGKLMRRELNSLIKH